VSRVPILEQLAKFAIETSEDLTSWGVPLPSYFVQPRLTTAQGALVSVDYLFEPSLKAIIVAGAGTGKTTLLNYLAYVQAKKYLQHPKNTACPLLLYGRDFHRIESQGDFIGNIATLISKRVRIEVHATLLEEMLTKGDVSLLVDGLDEVASQYRLETIHSLSQLSSYYPHLSILISSRPSALTVAFSGFSYLHLSGFDADQIHALVKRLSTKPEMTQRFLMIIAANRSLGDLSANPLLLRLLWSVFESRGAIPTNPTFLYSDFTDYLLSTWEQRKGIGQRGSLTLDVKHRLLEQVATYLFERQQTHLNVGEFRKLILSTIAEFTTDGIDDTVTFNDLTSSGLVILDVNNTVCFAHYSFLEYYAARALRRQPSLLINLLSRPDAHGIIVFACGLMDDIAPLIEAAIEKRQVVLAAKCISYGRTSNDKLASYVIQEFTREIGEPFISLLIQTTAQRQETAPEDIYSILTSKWYRVLEQGIASHEKGKRFEEFASDFFGQVFKVVSRDLNTENGELDLVLEIVKSDPFWIEFGGDALVECKNLNSNSPLKEVGAFAHKVGQARVKLAFFVSVSGFTDDAKRTLRNQASNVNAPLVVPIEGKDIERAILKKELLEEFFKEMIRGIKYLRKY
jgi:hypothetical protein